MKRLSVFSTLFLATVCLMSCQDQVQQIAGNYSYKISGSVVIAEDTFLLANETGALEVLRVNADSAVVTFNALLGQAYATQAVIAGKQMELLPFKRTITVRARDYEVTAQAKGDIYDGTLLLNLQYENAERELKADSLILLCKKN